MCTIIGMTYITNNTFWEFESIVQYACVCITLNEQTVIEMGEYTREHYKVGEVFFR